MSAISQPANINASELLAELHDPEGNLLTASQLQHEPARCRALELLLTHFAAELLPQQREVLMGFLGLANHEPRSQTELATTLGVTRARVSAISKQALRRLVKTATAQGATVELSSSQTLANYRGDEVHSAIRWAELSDEDLRREAAKAAQVRDGERLWGLANAYLTLYGAKGGNVSEKTRKVYKRGILDLLESWQGENLLRPGRDAGAIYIRRLETEPYRTEEVNGKTISRYRTAATVSVKIAAARTLYKALNWARATQERPFDNVSPAADPTPPEEKRGAYSPEEIDSLLELADEADAVFVLLGAHGGLRISEAAALRWQDINWRAGEMLVQGKGGKRAWVPCSDRLLTALRKLYNLRRNEELALPYRDYRGRERFQKLCLAAGVQYEGREVHGMRHGAGTLIYDLSGDLGAAADHLRHANIQTTRRYAKQNRVKRRKSVRDL